MNNKGQSLVLFVMTVPIIFMLLFMVYDIGNMILLKQTLNNINYLALDYGLDNIDNENITSKLNNVILKNKNDIDKININIHDNKIYIDLEDNIDTRISLIKSINVFNIKSSYVGYIQDDKKIIERDN